MVCLEVISSSTSVGLFLAFAARRHVSVLGRCHISSWRRGAGLVGTRFQQETIRLSFKSVMLTWGEAALSMGLALAVRPARAPAPSLGDTSRRQDTRSKSAIPAAPADPEVRGNRCWFKNAPAQ